MSSEEQSLHHLSNNFPGQLSECRLCCRSNETCIDLSAVADVIPLSYIQKNIGIKLKFNTPNFICKQCTQQILDWQKFVRSCTEAQSVAKDRQNYIKEATEQANERPHLLADETIQNNMTGEKDSSQENGLSTIPDKRSRFTLEYLEQKIGRVLKSEEIDQLKKCIDKGDDRGIFSFLFGSGNNQTWPCQLCDEIIKGTMKQVAKHYAQEHQASPLYPCQLCGKVIKSSHTYKRHRTAHLSEYKCPSCDKVFQDRSKLLAHKVAHSDNRPHVCGECGKQYKLASHLKSHMSRSHLPESDRLAFTCEICGKRFSAKGNLTTHVQTTHSDSKPYVCDLCGKGVKTKQALQFHLNSHNGVKQFSCGICFMSFTSRSSMASHTRRHTGEKPYPCKQCNKTFTSSSARSSHRQHVHATSRQHVCPHCSKSFKVLRDLKVHLSIHTGEKPYVCDTCGKAFRVAANFYAHRKTHRKAVEKISLDAAVAEIGQFIEEQQQQEEQQQPAEEVEQIHTLQMAQPRLNDALSQAIQEHLTQSCLVVGGDFSNDPSASASMLNPYSAGIGTTSDGLDYATIHPDEQSSTPGYLKSILMGQFDDKD